MEDDDRGHALGGPARARIDVDALALVRAVSQILRDGDLRFVVDARLRRVERRGLLRDRAVELVTERRERRSELVRHAGSHLIGCARPELRGREPPEGIPRGRRLVTSGKRE